MMKVKVCGMKNAENIKGILALRPDYMGFIFYPKSPRYVEDLSAAWIKSVRSVKKVGVFVNAALTEVLQTVADYGLDAVQLHGAESPLQCSEIKRAKTEVIKAFGISEHFDWSELEAYQSVVDYFLFDTKHKDHGGSGKVFDWGLLENYRHDVPYFLSGGLDVHNLKEVVNIMDNRLFAVDLNSRFEISAGMKDVALLQRAMSVVR